METEQSNSLQPVAEKQRRCMFCGKAENLVWVHGHGQCAHCKVNAMPCCDGATRTTTEEKPED